jgi:Amt family ammonium transporter
MTGSPSTLLVGTLGIALFLAPALALFFGGIPTRRRALALALSFVGGFLLATGEWVLLGSNLGVSVFQGALAATSVTTILAVGLRLGRLRGYLTFSAVWVTLVLVPVGYSLFDVVNGSLAANLGALDFGGVAVIALCTGTAAAAISMVSRRLGNAVGGPPRRTRLTFLYCAIAGVVGLLAVNVGSELVIDATTPRVVANELFAAGAGTIGWTIAQVVNVRRATVAGLVAGTLAGSIVVLAASPWFDTTTVVVLGLGAGVLGHVSSVAARNTGGGTWATLLGVCLVPGALGMLAAGIVAHGPGLVYSGHVELLASQFGGLVLVLGYSLVIALVLAIVIDRTMHLTGSSRFVDETIARLYASLRAGDLEAVRAALHPEMQWPDGWTLGAAVSVPVRTHRLRGGWIAVRFAEGGLVHSYHENNGLFDRMELR